MTEPPPEPSIVSSGWRRERFHIALVGAEAVRHHDLLARAGYRVRSAADGNAASELFVPDEPLDAIVVDFALGGRPPEAILLFARRTNAAAPLIAVVPAHESDAYRRAFHAGARDVLPAPARGEDLVAAVDLVLEPRALSEALERLRTALGVDDEATPLATAPDGRRSQIGALEGEIARLRQDLESHRARQKTEGARLRQQALDAVTERDRALESREAARKKLALAKKELRERDAELRMVERACEELQRKLKDARDQRRVLESRLGDAERRASTLEASLRGRLGSERRVLPLGRVHDERTHPPGLADLPPTSGEHRQADPEEALTARAEDERRLAALDDALRERARLEARVRDLEAMLEQEGTFYSPQATVPEMADASELERHLSRRDEDERRLAELEDLLGQRERLLAKLAKLEDALSDHDARQRRVAELERMLEERDARLRRLEETRPMPVAFGPGAEGLEAELLALRERHAETLGVLDAVRTERDGLRRRLGELEREAADALMRVDELSPLLSEVEHLRAQLRRAEEGLEEARARLELADLARATVEDQLAARQRELILAHAKGEIMSATVEDLRAQLAFLQRSRDEAWARIAPFEAELESLRLQLAALPVGRRPSP